MLYVNGDSFTWGSGLDSRYDIWPVLLAKRLNYEMVNDARPSSSNFRIVRTAIKFLSKHRPNIAVIVWSSDQRFEAPYTEAELLEPKWIKYSCWDWEDDRAIMQYNNYDTGYEDSKNLFINKSKTYYQQFFNEKHAHEQFLDHVILLQSLFNECKIPYVFINALNNYDNKFYQSNPKIKLINAENFIGWPDKHLGNWFDQSLRLPCGHLNQQGHIQLAEMIYNHVTDNRS